MQRDGGIAMGPSPGCLYSAPCWMLHTLGITLRSWGVDWVFYPKKAVRSKIGNEASLPKPQACGTTVTVLAIPAFESWEQEDQKFKVNLS